MVQRIEPTKMHDKDDGDPNSDELACNWNQLQPKPKLFDMAFFNDAPSIIKRNQGLPRFDTGFFEHAVHTDMPANSANDKNNPAHDDNLIAGKCKVSPWGMEYHLPFIS